MGRNGEFSSAQHVDPSTFVSLRSTCGVRSHYATDRLSDSKQAYYAQEAREFLRKKLISKQVRVHVDFIRPREGEYEERESATIRFGNQNVWV